MSEPTQGSISIHWQHGHNDDIQVWVNNRCIASLTQEEHGSKTIREVIRVLELTAGELGIFFFR